MMIQCPYCFHAVFQHIKVTAAAFAGCFSGITCVAGACVEVAELVVTGKKQHMHTRHSLAAARQQHHPRPHLRQNLQQLVVRQEVEAWEGAALGLQVALKGLLQPFQGAVQLGQGLQQSCRQGRWGW